LAAHHKELRGSPVEKDCIKGHLRYECLPGSPAVKAYGRAKPSEHRVVEQPQVHSQTE